MNLRSRLNRLEAEYAPGNCGACADRRGQTFLVDAGDAADEMKLPPPCRVCGEVAETVVVIIEEVVSTADELAGAERDADGPMILQRSAE